MISEEKVRFLEIRTRIKAIRKLELEGRLTTMAASQLILTETQKLSAFIEKTEGVLH